MATGELETGREFDEGGTTPRYAERRPIGSLLVQPQSSEIAESKKANFRVIMRPSQEPPHPWNGEFRR